MNNNDEFNKFMQYKISGDNSSSGSSSQGMGWKGLLIFIAVIVGASVIYNVMKPKGSSNRSYTYSDTNYSRNTTYTKATNYKKSNSYETRKTTTQSANNYYYYDDYNVYDYDDPEDFYEDYYDEFDDYEDAEDYWNDYN